MNTLPKRLVIYPKDVMNITGRRERAARKLLASIRRKYNKDCHAFITIEEFCQYTGIPEDMVRRFLW